VVKTWKSEKGYDEKCEQCGAIYAVTITRFPARDSDSFKCQICGNLMKKWNSTESYGYELKSGAASRAR